jgi:hypothetical protein
MPVSDYLALKTESLETEILKQAEKETEIRWWISITSNQRLPVGIPARRQ